MKELNLEIYEVFTSSCGDKNKSDLLVNNNIILKNIPFFNESGEVIDYDTALEIYGEQGLGDDIWLDDNYIQHIINYTEF